VLKINFSAAEDVNQYDIPDRSQDISVEPALGKYKFHRAIKEKEKCLITN
jgi:hypothetical protein